MKTRFTLRLRLAALAFLLATASASLHAMTNQSGCAAAMVRCFNTAANLPDFFSRSAAGFDCAVDFASCVRNAIYG
jgi:hypothetical protein